ncbi:zinc ABC transporter substrate-binding protein [Sporosarcina sp. FSL W7-1349]|uniref:metal ABC transporter solute-binding protein, Zn/Mn family n=1 Tax=Bacillales TaxID=1385 RepID=UPI00058235A2|nr:zinc ABC transporter substrate-binding protein [Bacillus sp. OxB-1]BAQ11837.1 zinc/manganese abc superfamily ATP binding cassette transporter, binding protein [Bacillus sp. OxB-1]
MRKLAMWFGVSLLAVFLLAACGNGNTGEGNQQGKNPDNDTAAATGDSKDDKLKVVTSFTIIADMARQIGGDAVDVYNLVPSGTDPHEYEPLPDDIKAATDADILFYNGLNLEGGKEGWFFKMIGTVGQKEENVFSVTERVEPMYLTNEDGREEEINPHAFIDPAVGIKMAEDMRNVLVKRHPSKSDEIQERGDEYVARLKELDEEYETRIADIPEEDRILVTSERAFQYMTTHYGLYEAYIWEIDTEENGSPTQIKNLVTFIKENEVPVLFLESNVDPRPMETVSKETGVPIAEKAIYSDEIGNPGDEIDTYVKYLDYNINLIHDELSKN